MSEFWDSKWLAWDITRSEFKLAKGAKAGVLGYKNNKKAATFSFLGQPPGVWSVCLGNDGNLQGKETDSDLVKLPKMDQLYKGVKMEHVGLPTTCAGETKYRKWYKDAVFCNGGYDANGNAKGGAGCADLDDVTANLFYCKPTDGIPSCRPDCESASPAEIAADIAAHPKAEDRTIKQCQNVASRMVQKNALMHSQAAYWVSIVVVQWADLLICKTRWLSIKQQGLRNSVLNFGLFFETLLAAWLCYGGVFSVLGTQPIRFTHWMPGVPWSMMIFMYDAARDFLFFFLRLDGAGARARRVEGREDNSDATTPPGARAGTRGDLNHTKTQVRRDAQVHDAGDVARGRRRRHGRRPAPGRLDREVDLLLGRPPPPLPPPEVYITHPL